MAFNLNVEDLITQIENLVPTNEHLTGTTLDGFMLKEDPQVDVERFFDRDATDYDSFKAVVDREINAVNANLIIRKEDGFFRSVKNMALVHQYRKMDDNEKTRIRNMVSQYRDLNPLQKDDFISNLSRRDRNYIDYFGTKRWEINNKFYQYILSTNDASGDDDQDDNQRPPNNDDENDDQNLQTPPQSP